MIYYAIKQQLQMGYEETVILNFTSTMSSFLSVKEQFNNIVDDQFVYRVYQLEKTDFDVLKKCSNHTNDRQTMLFQFIDRGSVMV